MTPTAFFAALLDALVPVVADRPVWVTWHHHRDPVRLWTGPERWLGPRWELWVTVKDGGHWYTWSPHWQLTPDLFAVAPPSLPAEYVGFFERELRAGELHPVEVGPDPPDGARRTLTARRRR